jgi:hypothetical protein
VRGAILPSLPQAERAPVSRIGNCKTNSYIHEHLLIPVWACSV